MIDYEWEMNYYAVRCVDEGWKYSGEGRGDYYYHCHKYAKVMMKYYHLFIIAREREIDCKRKLKALPSRLEVDYDCAKSLMPSIVIFFLKKFPRETFLAFPRTLHVCDVRDGKWSHHYCHRFNITVNPHAMLSNIKDTLRDGAVKIKINLVR